MDRTYSNVMTTQEQVGYEIMEHYLQLQAKVCIFYEDYPMTQEFIINTIHDPKFGMGKHTRAAFTRLISAIIKDAEEDA
jgi:hypothetical protein